MGFFFYNIAYFQKKMEYLPKGLGRGPPQKYAGSSYVQQSYHSSPLRSASPSRPPDSSSWPCGLSLSPQPLVEIQTQQLVNEGATSKAPWGGPDAGPPCLPGKGDRFFLLQRLTCASLCSRLLGPASLAVPFPHALPDPLFPGRVSLKLVRSPMTKGGQEK